MNNGTISNNTAYAGGGVYLSSGTFTMSGGIIASNTGKSAGGGVRVGDYDGTFNKTGGTIYGYTKEDSNSNVAQGYSSGGGHAVFARYSVTKVKETTAGSGVNLYFSRGSFSGAWDN
jgi:hypothetical protein